MGSEALDVALFPVIETSWAFAAPGYSLLPRLSKVIVASVNIVSSYLLLLPVTVNKEAQSAQKEDLVCELRKIGGRGGTKGETK